MNRTSNRRYKAKISDQTIESNDSRWRDSNDCSEKSSDDDDEDEDENLSRNLDSEFSEEESAYKKREWEALARFLRVQKARAEQKLPDKFQMSGTKREKRDKMTQKNLMSPMPSMWKPPVYKEISRGPNFKVIKSKEVTNGESDFMLRYLTGLQSSSFICNEEKKKPCTHKPTPTEIFKKFYMKYKKEAEHKSKKDRCKKLHTCVDMNLSSTDTYSPQVNLRQQDNENGTMVHSQCGLPIRHKQQNLRKEPENDKSGKKKEKLVYVVEEEGKSTARMETDLFSLNEILTIKKDLLELSEFAKKLKKLKEVKRESDKDRNSEAECQCKAVTELLKDVNKRMEALEGRQEELERIQKVRECEMDTKITDDTKPSSVTPPSGVVKLEPSAAKSLSSFKESEMTNVSGEGTLSKNLEIVNELLDIKSQLQRLERRRMSKELSAEFGPAGNPSDKTKDLPINVFSSKTYILTTEAYNRRKNAKEITPMDRLSSFVPLTKEKASEQLESFEVKDSVVEWLKNISTRKSSNSNVKEQAEAKGSFGKENTQEGSWGLKSTRNRIPETGNFEKQEPQKNRAKDAGRLETNHSSSKVNGEVFSKPNRKEERFPWRYKPKETSNREDLNQYFVNPVPPKHEKPLAKPRKVASSSSVPSAITVKQHIKHVKKVKRNFNQSDVIKPSRSKSVHEFTSSSCLSKYEKMLLNMRKQAELRSDPKRVNEDVNENEIEKEKMNYFLSQLKCMSLNRSQLVASMNLEEESTNLNKDKDWKTTRTLPLFPFPILPPEVYKILACCEDRSQRSEENKESCRREVCDEKQRKHRKEKDECDSCTKRRHKKKTRIKCSRNHCCNKKARKAASPSSRCHCQRPSPSTCRKAPKECHCRKCYTKKTHSSCSSSTAKKEEEKFIEDETLSDSCRKDYCRKKTHRKCKKHKPKKKCHHKTKKKDRECCLIPKCDTSCQVSDTLKPSTPDQTSEAETPLTAESEYEKTTEQPISSTSEQTNESPEKSFLKQCKSENRSRSRSFYDDPCYIASLWKTLRKIYPRFSTLQLMSWLRFYCQEERRTKEQNSQKKRREEERKPKERMNQHNCPTCQCKGQPQHFQCCKSYRMSTPGDKWSSVGLSSKISEYSVTEAETQSCDSSTETDFMFPYRKPKQHYLYSATYEEDQTEDSEKTKKSKRKEEEKSSGKEELSETNESDCECDQCGDIHSRKEKKVSYDKTPSKRDEKPEKKTKSSKKGKGSKKSIFARLGDVRHLQVCEGKIKCPKFKFYKNRTDCECISGESNCKCGAKGSKSKKEGKDSKYCHCRLKLEELENRVASLETNAEKTQKKQESEESHEHQKEKKKKRRKKEEKEKESSSEDECEIKEKKDKKKTKKKKKEEKENGGEDECEIKKEKDKKKRKKKKKEEKENGGENECETEKEKEKKKRMKKKKEKEKASGEDECETKKEKDKKRKKKKEKEKASGEDECKTKKKKAKKRKKKKEEEDENEKEKESYEEDDKRRKKRKCSKEGGCEKKAEKKKKEVNEKCDCDGKAKNDKKREKKKKERSSADEEQEVTTHYCKCMGKRFRIHEGDSEETATTKSGKYSLRKTLEKKKKEILEKLLSLTSFWRNSHKKNSNYNLIDDSSRSSSVPRKRSIWPAETEPDVIRKMKKTKKQKKNKKAKESKGGKSKSKRSRHK